MIFHSIRKILILLCFVLSVNFTHAQYTMLDFHHYTLADVLQLEENYYGTRVTDMGAEMLPLAVAPPVQYVHAEDDWNMVSTYYYRKKDTGLHYVLYVWRPVYEIAYESPPVLSAEEVFHFIEKYKEICRQLSAVYGESKGDGNLNEVYKIERGTFSREDNWQPDDSTKIHSTITMSSRYEVSDSTDFYPEYTIRLAFSDPRPTVVKPSKPLVQMLSASKMDTLDSVFRLFIAHLRQRNIAQAKALLSPAATEAMSDAAMQILVNGIDEHRALKVIFGGYKSLEGTGLIPALYYKYVDDRYDPPRALITAYFDNQNRVIEAATLRKKQ